MSSRRNRCGQYRVKDNKQGTQSTTERNPMSDYCYSFPVFKRVLERAEMMDRMVKTVDVNPLVAARVENGMAWYEARTRCLECASGEQCRAWLANAPITEVSDVPDLCPNANFFRECKVSDG